MYYHILEQPKIMTRVAGFTVERTATGSPMFARIDLRKHADLIPILEENGFEIEKKAAVGKIPRGSISSEEFWENSYKMVNDLCDKYGIV